jgi:hypothetical protein
MEIQVAQVNKATIKDVISIRSNDANSAVVVFKDAAAFNTAKKILSSAKMKFTPLHVTLMMYLPQGTALLVTV